MKKLKKILKWTFIVLIVAVVGLISYGLLTWKKTYDGPFPAIHASTDSAVIARGKYLAFGPAHCSGCHSPLDKQPLLAQGQEIPLEGGFVFDIPPGKFYSPNITPDPETGIGKLTDEQIARSLRHGVGYDGRCMVPFMPFQNLSDEDLTAIISWLRVQPPVKKEIPKHEVSFIGKMVYAYVLRPEGPSGTPPVSVKQDTTVDYGKYLAASVANCRGCHTNRSLMTGAYIGPEYAGGFVMPSGIDPKVTLSTPNLTPDPETGRMANWSQKDFIERFRKGRSVPASDMPWEQFQRLTDNDLIALYKFFKSLAPVKNDTGPSVVSTGS